MYVDDDKWRKINSKKRSKWPIFWNKKKDNYYDLGESPKIRILKNGFTSMKSLTITLLTEKFKLLNVVIVISFSLKTLRVSLCLYYFNEKKNAAAQSE